MLVALFFIDLAILIVAILCLFGLWDIYTHVREIQATADKLLSEEAAKYMRKLGSGKS